MPAIPEFLLRKLFVPGSLKPAEAGFSFELNNTFAPVTLSGLELSADSAPCPPAEITIFIAGQDSISATAITAQSPITLPVNVVVAIAVEHAVPQKSLGIRANTLEAGPLQFTIPLSGKKIRAASPGGLIKKILRPARLALQARRVRPDPQHPGLHFTPPANWMNDPNGLIYWQGHYHLFYQHNPYEPTWGSIHWGHAVSQDLLHWRHLPLALAPDSHGADAGGCFSGCAVESGEGVALLYTAVYPETQCLALSRSSYLRRWKKNPQPVIPAPPTGLHLEGFRDPWVWKEANEWRMLIGSGLQGIGGAVLLYRSSDLLQWEYLDVMFQGDAQASQPLRTGTMWECPAFFPLGDKWVLLVSACEAQGPLHTFYFVGEYRQQRFIPDYPARLLDHGAQACFYAPQTLLDEKGRRVMLGWLREARGPAEQARAGWSGALSFPRSLSLTPQGELQSAPLEGLQSLRREHLCLQESAGAVTGAGKGGLELLLKVPQATGGWSGLTLRSGTSPACVQIGYDSRKERVVLDCRQAGGFISEVPLENPAMEQIALHIFVDGSVLELFIEDRQPVSARFYFQGRENMKLEVSGGASGDLWQLGK